ncbi:MAG: SCO family protein [Acidimicrobiales bacterium]|nr:SCO family protein [Acidimicrobiales bacterium]
MVDKFHITRRRLIGAGAATGLGLLLGACGLEDGGSAEAGTADPDAGWSGTLVDPPFTKPDVTFTDFNGKPFPFKEKTEGRLTMLFFGYTSCPDVCPVYLNTLASALDAIDSGPGSRPIVLFVGVDVARDTPKKMKEYLGQIDDSFIGLTAEEPVIAKAIAHLKLGQPVIHEPDKDGNYAVDHPAGIIVFSPDNLGHRIFPANVRQKDWVKDLPRLDEGIYRTDQDAEHS